MSLSRCLACSRPLAPPPGEPVTLDQLLVAELLAEPDGVVVARLARAVQRRRVDVEAALERLADTGIATRGEPRGVGRGSRGRPWTLTAAGRISDASPSGGEAAVGLTALVAGLGALVAAHGRARWLALAGLALLAIAVAIATAAASPASSPQGGGTR
jgi:hypothetical protein